MIYLDNAATSFPRPEQVYIEMDRVNRNLSAVSYTHLDVYKRQSMSWT